MKKSIQKTEQQKNKLSFNKFQIAKIQKPQAIVGGDLKCSIEKTKGE